MTDGISIRSYWRLLNANRNMRYLWLAQLVSEFGDWFYALVVIETLLQVTGRAASILFFFALISLPQIALSPLAGALNDRFERKRVMIVSDLLRTLVLVAMLFALQANALPLLYLLIATEAAISSSFEPARTAVISSITFGAERVVANTLSATTWSLVLATGAGIGGLLAVWLGRSKMFALDAATFIISAALISRMRFAEPHAGLRRSKPWADLFGSKLYVEGFQYVVADKRRTATLALKAALGWCVGTNWVLLPVLGNRTYHISAFHLSLANGGLLATSILICSRGVGSFSGPLVASLFTQSSLKRMRLGVGYAFLLIASGFLGEAFAHTILLTSLAAAFAHAGSAIVWVFSTTLLQSQTADQYRGRVFATEAALTSLTILAAAGFASLTIDANHLPSAVAFTVAIAFLVFAASWFGVQTWWKASDGVSYAVALE